MWLLGEKMTLGLNQAHCATHSQGRDVGCWLYVVWNQASIEFLTSGIIQNDLEKKNPGKKTLTDPFYLSISI